MLLARQTTKFPQVSLEVQLPILPKPGGHPGGDGGERKALDAKIPISRRARWGCRGGLEALASGLSWLRPSYLRRKGLIVAVAQRW